MQQYELDLNEAHACELQCEHFNLTLTQAESQLRFSGQRLLPPWPPASSRALLSRSWRILGPGQQGLTHALVWPLLISLGLPGLGPGRN